MNVKSIIILLLATAVLSVPMFAGNNSKKSSIQKIDMTSWLYNEEDDVYYKTGIIYCENPTDLQYQTMGIFVPGKFFKGKKNSDGTYSVSINKKAKAGNYKYNQAPIVFPVNTPGYSAMQAPSGYAREAAQYTSEGFIYMFAGCRGRNEGAPLGVTDLKAAVRYYRYNAKLLPGSTERIFSFGMSGGGAQSALMGATGDSALYSPYLEEMGAVMSTSDAICGSMDWCPITNLNVANEAYEWNMGATRTDLDEEMQALSDGLTATFASMVNSMGLKDDDGNILVLEQSADGRYQAGTFYDWIKAEIERSLNNFLSDTSFPYDSSVSSKGGFGGPGGQRGPEGLGAQRGPGGPENQGGQLPREMPGNGVPAGGIDFTQIDNIMRKGKEGNAKIEGVYKTVEDYITALNTTVEWVQYDKNTNTATITSIADFAAAVKPASKNVGAFDDVNCSQGENTLFGYGNGKGSHWDSTMAELLKNTSYGQAYAEDCQKVDSLGNTVTYRMNAYTPLYYLLESSEGYKTAKVAKYWRIRSGIFQGDTSVTTEATLAQALKNYGIDSVDFEMVWGQKHVETERSGSSSANFIQWVKDLL